MMEQRDARDAPGTSYALNTPPAQSRTFNRGISPRGLGSPIVFTASTRRSSHAILSGRVEKKKKQKKKKKRQRKQGRRSPSDDADSAQESSGGSESSAESSECELEACPEETESEEVESDDDYNEFDDYDLTGINDIYDNGEYIGDEDNVENLIRQQTACPELDQLPGLTYSPSEGTSESSGPSTPSEPSVPSPTHVHIRTALVPTYSLAFILSTLEESPHLKKKPSIARLHLPLHAMSAFTALNVEPDENPQEDIDNTREIQIEEALKLYQNALKLHSQGPQFYQQAAAAYDTLFKSDIFTYPEGLSEYDRLELHPEAEIEPDLAIGLELDIAAAAGSEITESLRQILFLAFKNNGQFIIDVIKHKLRSGHEYKDDELRPQYSRALERFTQALARDESDTELWRRAARISALLGSQRIARYCLEAAVEVDDDPAQRELEPSGLEEGFAGVILKEHLDVLEDDVALSHPIMAPYEKKIMSARLRKYLDPYPFLPDLVHLPQSDEASNSSTIRITVDVADKSWIALGDALLRACLNAPGCVSSVTFAVPESEGEVDVTMAEVQQSPKVLPLRQQPEPELVASPVDDTSTGVSAPTDSLVLHDANAQAEQSPQDQDASQESRKRSQSAAGLRDTPDDENGQQKRSKRIRNRDTLGAESLPVDPAAQHQEQLAGIHSADNNMFSFINGLLERLEISGIGSFEALQNVIDSNKPLVGEEKLHNTIVRDLRDILQNWNETKAGAFIAGSTADIFSSQSASPVGLAAFLEHGKTGPAKSSSPPSPPSAIGVPKYLRMVNNGWLTLQDVAYEYFNAIQNTYEKNTWPDTMKYNLVQLMSSIDSALYTRVEQAFVNFEGSEMERENMDTVERLCQMLFELHLDLYVSITNPSSRVDPMTRTMEKERLARWSVLAKGVWERRPDELDDMLWRYLWSQTLCTSLNDDVAREYMVECWTDIKYLLEKNDSPVVTLQNNAAMPEVSVAAADREISKLTTADFFLNLFSSDHADPVVVIETLEPVLDPQSIEGSALVEQDSSTADASTDDGPTQNASISPALRSMWKFLEGGNASLRLFLWQRLRDAYNNIDYCTKVFSCYLKSIEVIVADMISEKTTDADPEIRQHMFLSWLKTLDDLLVKALTLALNNSQAFEIIDDAHIKSSAASLVHLCRCLHSAAMFDDQLKIGAIQVPQGGIHHHNGPFGALLARLREMQVRAWALLYTLLKDGMSQNTELFPAMESDLADYLAVVHLQLGLRKTCKISNKIFLKMMKVEMIRFKHVERWDDYLGQVLYDLYDVKLGVGVFELVDHGCTTENLDRRTAISIADKVIGIATQMSVKDLLKHDLRGTIEKMQQVLGATKTTPAMQHNLRNVTEYLKSAVNPLDLYRAIKGQLSMDSVSVSSPDCGLANMGWYFLHGMMALTKFKLQKKLAPGATDDLRVAMSFFRLQLQFKTEHWETWYRLAQVYDADLEENILFSADKLNSTIERKVLIGYQRSAIHCYAMALSYAMQNADSTFETASKLSDLQHEFAMRVYASSRDPFAMEAFYLDDFKRFFSGPEGMYKAAPHAEMQTSQTFRYAARLFIRASVEKPDFWLNYYMLGKCYWKVYCRQRPEDQGGRVQRITRDMILHVLEKAIETCPRPTRNDPFLEPHYKYMAIMHKFVCRQEIDPQEAANKMQQQPYAINKGENVEIANMDDWIKYILASLRNLQHADKSSWHHRIVFRIARILHAESDTDVVTAAAARQELKITIFTKTMAFNVWKPENERAGRHCVYTGKYIVYTVQVLLLLNDRLNLEQLVKRVRKKPADIYQFNQVWSTAITAYLELLRTDSKPVVKHDDIIKLFAGEGDQFILLADALKKHVDENPEDLPRVYPFMKEAEDLKKLNGSLIKTPAIDELLMDLYADVVHSVGLHLVLTKPEPVAPVPEPRPQGPMSINSMLGVVETPIDPPAQPPAPVLDKPRARAPGKKDILRRAEALLTKTEPPKLPVAAVQRPKMGLTGKSANGSANGSYSGSGKEGEAKTAEGEDAPVGDEDVDERGSAQEIDDDADDESDLSDAPDVEDIEMPFPNLGRAPGSWGPEKSDEGKEE